MIGEVSGAGGMNGPERVQRSVEKERDTTAASLVETLPANADSANLSAAALALARNVQPVGAGSEQEAVAGKQEDSRSEMRRDRRIDIRV